LACEMLNIPAHATLFAGDDVRDIQAGRAAGTMTAAVLYGYGSYELNGPFISGSATVRQPVDFIELVQSNHS